MTEVLPRLEQPKSYSFDESKLSTYPRPLLTEEGDHSNGFQPTFTTVLPNIHSEGYTLTSYASYIGDPRKLVVHYVWVLLKYSSSLLLSPLSSSLSLSFPLSLSSFLSPSLPPSFSLALCRSLTHSINVNILCIKN